MQTTVLDSRGSGLVSRSARQYQPKPLQPDRPCSRKRMTDLVSANGSAEWIVCGYFTPDYQPRTAALIASLERLAIPYHFFAWDKAPGGWETNTRLKPKAILEAMDIYPDKVLIWLDVDFTVHGDLSPLANLRADVAAHVTTKKHKWHSRLQYRVLSAIMVFRPTLQARSFVQEWQWIADSSARLDNDQRSLLQALGKVPGVTFEKLPEFYFAGSTVLRHYNAGATLRASRWLRRLPRLRRWRGPPAMASAS
jgi:hypothetical protein